jgi:site-specific recombinase XerD
MVLRIEPSLAVEVAASEWCVENPCYGWEAASMGKIKAKPNYRRTILRLPDLDHSKLAVLNSLTSPGSRRVYEYAIEQFIAWYCSEPRLAFNRIVAVRYRMFLEGRGLAANTINQQLAAVRRLAYEAADAGLLSPELAAGIARVKGVKQLGHRSGNWLSLAQSSQVLKNTGGDSLRAKRDYAMLAVLLGCGLRRSELVGLETDEIQTRQDHWTIVDLIGKGRRVRTVPIPHWVKQAMDRWVAAAGITEGKIFRAVTRRGKVWGKGISQNLVWCVVRNCCKGVGLEHIAPHDLRRTCAKLCHSGGGELEQIQFLLGHLSVQTTERYLGCKQNLGHPVNDRFTLDTRLASSDWEMKNHPVRQAEEVARKICPIEPEQEIKSYARGDEYAELTPVRGTKLVLENARTEMVIDRTGRCAPSLRSSLATGVGCGHPIDKRNGSEDQAATRTVGTGASTDKTS